LADSFAQSPEHRQIHIEKTASAVWRAEVEAGERVRFFAGELPEEAVAFAG